MSRPNDTSELPNLRKLFRHGEGQSQAELDQLAARLAGLPEGLGLPLKVESLPLFDRGGRPLGTTAPRWLCHLMALRHRCAHILLTWRSPELGDVLILQIRDWAKDDSPGRLDISVGGHMNVADSDSKGTALTEMPQELGFTASDLDGELTHVKSYSFDEERAEDHVFNSEWRDVYVARLMAGAISRLRFRDGEVAGLALLPVRGAERLLKQEVIPMASALKASLPKCLGLVG